MIFDFRPNYFKISVTYLSNWKFTCRTVFQFPKSANISTKISPHSVEKIGLFSCFARIGTPLAGYQSLIWTSQWKSSQISRFGTRGFISKSWIYTQQGSCPIKALNVFVSLAINGETNDIISFSKWRLLWREFIFTRRFISYIHFQTYKIIIWIDEILQNTQSISYHPYSLDQ